MAEFRLSALAEDDLTAIWGYVAEYNEGLADSLLEKLVKRFVLLATFQDAGRSRPELTPGLGSFPLEHYIIFYRAIPEGIEVIRVLHGSRDIKPQIFDMTAEKSDDAEGVGEGER